MLADQLDEGKRVGSEGATIIHDDVSADDQAAGLRHVHDPPSLSNVSFRSAFSVFPELTVVYCRYVVLLLPR